MILTISTSKNTSLAPLIDLHSHSTVSDGSLTPAELVGHAAGLNVAVLALTDHDDVAGLDEARRAAEGAGIALVNGVEISVTWNNRTLHVVGLRIDPSFPALQQGLEHIREGRAGRAERIAAELAKHGIQGSLEGAYGFANERIISRTHFARFLVSRGYAKDLRTVFKKFLVQGKPGHVSHRWAELGEAIGWIRGSGGIPVLAHPGRYDMGRATLENLLAEFKEAGGQAIEVISGSHSPDMNRQFAEVAVRHGLLASRGSDYHSPEQAYLSMDRLPELPPQCTPVWRDWHDLDLHLAPAA